MKVSIIIESKNDVKSTVLAKGAMPATLKIKNTITHKSSVEFLITGKDGIDIRLIIPRRQLQYAILKF